MRRCARWAGSAIRGRLMYAVHGIQWGGNRAPHQTICAQSLVTSHLNPKISEKVVYRWHHGLAFWCSKHAESNPITFKLGEKLIYEIFQWDLRRFKASPKVLGAECRIFPCWPQLKRRVATIVNAHGTTIAV